MSTPETRAAIRRLMRYASHALAAKWDHDPIRLADLRTSTDDCRIAIRATKEQA